jgi:hypothetical protein
MNELSQQHLPIEKRFALVVSHNKWLMTMNALLKQELEAYKGLDAKYADLRWEFEKLKEERDFLSNDTSLNKKLKLAKRMFQEYGLFEKFLRRLKDTK